jgi:hypothetical protein
LIRIHFRYGNGFLWNISFREPLKCGIFEILEWMDQELDFLKLRDKGREKKIESGKLYHKGSPKDEKVLSTVDKTLEPINTRKEIANKLQVSTGTIAKMDVVKKAIKEDRNQKIFDMFMAGYTQEDIAKEVNMPQKTVDDHLKVLANIDKCPKPTKLSALFQDPDFTPSIVLLNLDKCPVKKTLIKMIRVYLHSFTKFRQMSKITKTSCPIPGSRLQGSTL